MRRIVTITILSLSALAGLGAPSRASAQGDANAGSDQTAAAQAPSAQPASAVQAPPPTELTPPMAGDERVDGPRFRGGVALTFGGEFFSDHEYSAMLFGIDGRFGAQINDLVGVYFAPHLSAGGKRGAGAMGATATLSALVMADFTLIDSLFVGAGAGYMTFGSLHGPALGFRVGGYPVKSLAKSGPRRRGLVVSLETRIGFMGEVDGRGVQLMGAVGYETF